MPHWRTPQTYHHTITANKITFFKNTMFPCFIMCIYILSLRFQRHRILYRSKIYLHKIKKLSTIYYLLKSKCKNKYERATEIILIIKIDITWVRVSSKALKPRIKIKLIENETKPKLNADKT